MMGDRDYRGLIRNAVDSIGRELDVQVDAKDAKTVHLHEVTRCMRRSYYDRADPLDPDRGGFNELLGGLLQKLGYGTEPAEYEVGQTTLRARADMIADDAVVLFRSSPGVPDNPRAEDLLYLNACLWIYDKTDGIIVYVAGDRKDASFSATRNKKVFEETARRVRVYADLLAGSKVPILEPSAECSGCQYYQRCYMKERVGRAVTLKELVGMGEK